MKLFKVIPSIVLFVGCVVGAVKIYQNTPKLSGSGSPVQASYNAAQVVPVTVTRPAAKATPTVIPTSTPNPYLQISISQTAVAVQQQLLNQQAQQISANQAALNLQLTSDAATQVAHAEATQTRVAEIHGTETATALVPALLIAGSSTASAATQIADVEQQEHRAQIFAIWAKRAILTGFGLVGILALAFWAFIELKARYFKLSQLKPDDKGRYPLVAEDTIPGTRKNLINPNLAHRATVSTTNDDLTADQALANANAQRQLEAVRALADSQAASRMLNKTMKPQSDQQPQADIEVTKPFEPVLLRHRPILLPEWSKLANSWDGKMLPYGQSEQGLLLADPAQEPHWLIVGRTRSGKSRYGTRTIAAAALTMGYQVLFIGKRVDFFPFEDHPNAKIIGVDLFNEPRKYFEVLQRIARLMKERDEYLTGHRQTTWQQTGLPQLYVVMDEFSSAVKQLNGVKAGLGTLVSTLATALIQEGGKYGLNIVQVVQDATGANVDVTARRNMGRMVFRLSEQRSSDIALGVNGEPSAVGLPARHFLSVVGDVNGVIHGVAFAPSDDEILKFLKDRPVPAHEPIDWIEGEARDVEPIPATETILEPVDDIDNQIMNLYLEQLSKDKVSLSAIQRAVYKRQIPSEFYHIQALVKEYQERKTTTTTTTTKNMPTTEPLAA